MYEFVKNDLDELTTAVKTEASAVLSSTSNAVKETLQVRFNQINCIPN